MIRQLQPTTYNPRPIRGQGLPISTIIIAVIGLLVLIIMGVLVTQKVGVFGKGTREQTDQKCEGAVGTPAPIGECQSPVYGTFTNLRADQICCKA